MSAGCSTTAQRAASLDHRATEAEITKIILQQNTRIKQTPPVICKQKMRRIQIQAGKPAWLDQADWLQASDEQDARTSFCYDLLGKALNE
jgi:hypothetical protein